jgi:phage shock protein A
MVNQSLENKLEFSKKELQNLRERIEELKNEKESLINRIAGIDPH